MAGMLAIELDCNSYGHRKLHRCCQYMLIDDCFQTTINFSTSQLKIKLMRLPGANLQMRDHEWRFESNAMQTTCKLAKQQQLTIYAK